MRVPRAVHTPLDVRIDALGRVVDWRDAVPWNTITGEDQAYPSYLLHHTEMGNVFSAGSYDAMDVTFYNYTIIGGDMGCYWKTYRRGLSSGPILELGSSTQRLVLPGGSGLVEIKDFTAPQLSVNHHCALGGVPTGGICASHYWYNHPAGSNTPVLLDESPAAVSNIIIEMDTANVAATYITDRADACFDTSSCDVSGSWLKCPQAWGIRAVRIYSPDRGSLSVTTDDGTYTVALWPVYNNPGIGAYGTYTPDGKAWAHGYNFLVKDGHAVTITIANGTMADELFVLEYSENTWPASKETSITLSVATATGEDASGLTGGPHTIQSTHPRTWITPYGAMIPQAGAWWDATGGWPATYTQAQYETDRVNQLTASGITWNVNLAPVPSTASFTMPTALDSNGLFYPRELSRAEINNYAAHAKVTQAG